jgi:hypothetical protein
MDRGNSKRPSADVGIAGSPSGWKSSARMACVASSAGERARRWIPGGVCNRVDVRSTVAPKRRRAQSGRDKVNTCVATEVAG